MFKKDKCHADGLEKIMNEIGVMKEIDHPNILKYI